MTTPSNPTIKSRYLESNNVKLLFFCMVGFILFLRTQPLWTVGFFQDDSLISSWKFEALLAGQSIYQYCYNQISVLIHYQGRIAPIYSLLIIPPQMAIEDNLIAFRAIQSLAQLLALASFVLFIKQLSKDIWFAWGCSIILCAIYEIRNYHDGAFTLFLVMPFLITVGCSSCYFALRASENKANSYNADLLLVLVLNTIGILTLEMASIFSFVACFLLLVHGSDKWKTRVTRTLIAGLPVLIVLIAGLYFKQNSSYAGTMIGGGNANIILSTYLKQLVSALPLSYLALDPQGIFEDSWFSHDVALPSLAILMATGLAAFCGIRRSRQESPSLLLMIGAILFLLPPLTISFSAKYQTESVAGVGYIQTVFSYMGISIIMFSLINTIHIRIRKVNDKVSLAMAVLIAAGIGLISSTSLISSYRVAHAINEHWRYPREQLEVWMDASPRSGDDNNELIVVEREWLARWENYYFFRQHRGTKGTFITNNAYMLNSKAIPDISNVVYLKYPIRSQPADLSLIVEGSSSEGGELIRAYVISSNRQKLSDYRLALMKGSAVWSFPNTTLRGKHGYFFRKLELQSDSALVKDYALVSVAP